MITARAWSAIRSGPSVAVAPLVPVGRRDGRPQPIGSAGSRAWSVARCAAGVGDVAADGQELPVVVGRVEREPQHAPRACLAELAVGSLDLECPQNGSPGPDDDLAEAARPLDLAGRVLRGEPD